MSSILDALNKLEKEKVRAEKNAALDRNIDPEAAARDLVGHSLLRDRFTLQLSPAMLVATLLGGSLILVISGIGASWAYFRTVPLAEVTMANIATPPVGSNSATPLSVTPKAEEQAGLVPDRSQAHDPDSASTLEPTPEPAPEPQDVVQEPSRDHPLSTQEATPELEVEPSAISADDQAEPELLETPPSEITAEPPAPLPEPLLVASETTSENLREELPADLDTQPTAAENVSTPSSPTEDDPAVEPFAIVSIQSKPTDYLPAFSPAVRTRHKIPKLRINFIHLGDTSKPRPYAWINNIPVYIGDQIQGSKARLKKVAEGGVALEIVGTKEQYFLKF